jgi:membrane protease YdiL (CAAX protease family)
MNALATTIRKYPLLSFWLLAILLAVLAIPLAIVTDVSSLFVAITEQTGEIPTTNILQALPLASQVEGGLAAVAVMAYQPATPLIAAFIVAFIIARRAGVMELISRYRPWREGVEWREGVKVWMVAIVTLVAVKLAMAALMYLLKGPTMWPQYTWSIDILSGTFLLVFITSLFADGGGLLEETGWRGFALPRLLQRMSSLRASVVLGVMWSLWHVPVKIGVLSSGLSSFLAFYALFTAICIFYTIVITYFFNRLGGSVLIGITLHGLMNDSAGLVGNAGQTGAVEDMIQMLIAAGCFGVAALVLVWLSGKELGRRNGTSSIGNPRASQALASSN